MLNFLRNKLNVQPPSLTTFGPGPLILLTLINERHLFRGLTFLSYHQLEPNLIYIVIHIICIIVIIVWRFKKSIAPCITSNTPFTYNCIKFKRFSVTISVVFNYCFELLLWVFPSLERGCLLPFFEDVFGRHYERIRFLLFWDLGCGLSPSGFVRFPLVCGFLALRLHVFEVSICPYQKTQTFCPHPLWFWVCILEVVCLLFWFWSWSSDSTFSFNSSGFAAW
jgi:hypothetical protein